MITMTISRAAELLGCTDSVGNGLAGNVGDGTAGASHAAGNAEVSAGVEFKGITTDSRQVVPGMLFAALAGQSFDGHDYIDAAVEEGAVGVIVSRDVTASVPVLQVEDMLAALAVLAKYWRQQCPARCIGITGSNGKTTVKEMIASILRQSGNVLATEGNFNNELGLPLTLFRLDPSHDYAVIEMGAAHPDDVAYLADIAKPEVGLITNIARAHLQGFGSLENVARAKGKLYAALPVNGTAIMNAAEPWLELWQEMNNAGSVQYFTGETERASSADGSPQDPGFRGNVTALKAGQDITDLQAGQDITTLQAGQDITALKAGQDITARHAGPDIIVSTPSGEFKLSLPLPGDHNLTNALAATAVCLAMDVSLDDIKAGLECVKPVPGRLNLQRSVSGWTVIDDTYNANPASLYAALQVLSTQDGVPWLVLGDMKELGGESRKMHAELGEAAQTFGVKRLYALGEASEAAADAFGPDGYHFENRDSLIRALQNDLHAGVVCLVKGSRSMGMEHVVNAISSKHTGHEASD